MKQFKFAYILFTLALVSLSCEEKLDQIQPQQSLSDVEALSDLTGLTAAMNGAYDGLQNVSHYGRNFQVNAEVEANLVYLSINNSNRFVQEYTYQWAADLGTQTGIWNAIYATILRANNIINNADNIDAATADKNQLKGEALCVRALCHFDLVRSFAKAYTQSNPTTDLGVPIILEAKIDEPARNTIAQVYDQIIADLTTAKGLMTDKSIYRFSPNAAEALLARVYLYKGDYAKAEASATSVIGVSKYSLTSDIVKAFAAPGSSEEIFTLKFTAAENRGADNLGQIYNPQGYGDIRVSNDLISLYEDADQRKAFIYKHTNGQFYQNKYAAQDAIPGLHSPKILRLAEMYLIRAEARARQNKFADAIADLNAIRAKRGASALSGIADANVLKTVWDERKRELSFEGHTKFDLSRNGLDMVRSQCNTGIELDAPCTVPISSHLRVYPIPQREMDVNQNMVQNPGYAK